MRIFDRSRPSALVLRLGLGAALGLAAGASCNLNPTSVFTCTTSEDCVAEAGMGAICEANNLCTVPDATCPDGKRWHERAAALADKCFEPGDLGGSDSVAATGSGSGTGSGGGAESTSGAPDPSTTNPVDGSGDPESSGPPPSMTDTGGSSSTGPMAGSCQELFGAAPGYELCEETPESCSFNATTGGGSCDDMCMMFNSTCITAFNNDMSDCASQMAEAMCSEMANDNICVCAKP